MMEYVKVGLNVPAHRRKVGYVKSSVDREAA